MVDHRETALIAQREARQDRTRKAPRKQAEARAHERSRTPYWRKRLVQWALPWRGDTDDEDSEDDSTVLHNQEIPAHEQRDQDDQQEEQARVLEVTSEQDRVADQIQEVQAEDDHFDEMGDDTQPQSPSPSPSAHFENLEPSSSSVVDETEDRQQSVEPRGSKRKAGSRSSTPVLSTRRTTRSQAARVGESPAPEESPTEEPQESATDAAETAGDLVQETEESTSKAGRKKKKKKNNKRRTKGVTYEEVEETEREIFNDDVSLEEKIQTSEELIEASERMLQHLDQEPEPSDDPFSESQEETLSREQDDETFHSTSQFELTESGDESKDGPESADITIDYDEVKYYPPDESKTVEESSVDGNVEMEDSTDVIREDVVAEEVEEVEEVEEIDSGAVDIVEDVDVAEEVEQVQEIEEIEAAPEAYIEDVLEVSEDHEALMESDDIPTEISNHEEAEFIEEDSELDEIHPTPETPANEHFEDCPPIVTPAAHKVKDVFVSERNELPESSTAFLALFFAKQAGKMLTPMQADYCKRLIDDAVVSSSSVEAGSTTWHAGEDGVSFKGQSKSSRSPALTLPTVPRDQSAIDTASPLAINPVRKASSTTSVLRAVKPIAPFKVIRQGVSDLYHEAGASETKQQIIPPLDDHLEINKYEGVAWDDLPGHVKVKRFLEWKGPEAPEVVRRRAMEERKKIREAFEEANKVVPDSLKRGADDVETELPSKKVLVAMAPVESPMVIDSTLGLTPSAESAPRLSAVAQEVLSIVNNTKAVQKHSTPASEPSVLPASTSNFAPSSMSIPATFNPAPFTVAALTSSSLHTSGHSLTSPSRSEAGKPGIFAIPAPTSASPSILSVPKNASPASNATEEIAAKPSTLGSFTAFIVPAGPGTFAPPKTDSSKVSDSSVATAISSSFSSTMPKASTFAEAPKASVSGNPFSFGAPASASNTMTSKPAFNFGGSNSFASMSNPVATATSAAAITPSSSAEVSSEFVFGGPAVTKTTLKPMFGSGMPMSTGTPFSTTATVASFGSTFSGFSGSSSKFSAENSFSIKSSDSHKPSIITIDDDDSTDGRSMGENGERDASSSQSPTQAGDVTIAFDEGDEDDDESFNLQDDDEDDEDEEDSFNEEHSGDINLEEYADDTEYNSQADQSFERTYSDQDCHEYDQRAEFTTASGKSSFGQSRFNFEFDTSMGGDGSDEEDQNANSQFGDEEDDEAMEQEWEDEVSEEEDGATVSPLASPVMTRRTL